MTTDRTALFAQLLRHYRAETDRRGWVHVTCPQCGKEGSRKNVHFSFSLDKGAKCQVCGYGANLEQLAAKVGLETGTDSTPVYVPPKPAPPKHYRWMDELPRYLAEYTSRQDRYWAWAEYRGLDAATVDRYRLGLGVFPEYSSQCQHERLMVPMLQNRVPVAFRGRSVHQGCDHKKWLTTATGGRPPLLFNGAVLLPQHERGMVAQYDLTDSGGGYCRGRVLVVVENPVDCILLESVGICAVATLGVTMWTQDRPWTALLKLARPKAVVVMYDHDLPGNGASSEREYAEMVADWRARQLPQNRDNDPPLSNGLRLANEINAAGVPAQRFHWPASAPVKADPGWLVERVGLEKIAGVVG